MLSNKPMFAIVSVSGATMNAVAGALGIKVNEKLVMPMWIITKSENRYLAVIGSLPICVKLSQVDENEMERTVWIPVSDIEIMAETEGSIR